MTSESAPPHWTPQPAPSLIGGTGRQLAAVLDRFEDLWRALDKRLASVEAAQEERQRALLAQLQAEVVGQISAHTDALRQEYSAAEARIVGQVSAHTDALRQESDAAEARIVGQISTHTDALRQEFGARFDETKAAVAASETSVIGQIGTHTHVVRQDVAGVLTAIADSEARVVSQIAAHTDVLRQTLAAAAARVDDPQAPPSAGESRIVSQIANHTDVLRHELGGLLKSIDAQVDESKAVHRYDQARAMIAASEAEVIHQISAHTEVLRRLIHSAIPAEPAQAEAQAPASDGSEVGASTLISLTTALNEVKTHLFKQAPPFPLDPLDETELSLLSSDERDPRPLVLEVSPPLLHRVPDAETLEAARLDPPEPRYVDFDGQPVTVDETLPPLRLHRSDEDPERPTFWAEASTESDERRTYWFEFDTTPAFNSPNAWRSPVLATLEGVLEPRELAGEPLAMDRRNRSASQGLTLTPLMTLDPFGTNDSPVVRSPFRLSAMRLPTDRTALDWTEMQRHGIALGAGLPREVLRREIFDYVRHIYGWALDTRDRHGPETFMAGMGGCGHIANVAATFLELNGVRTRKVAGFNPKLRAVWAAAGHTALEVQEESGDWSYFDPYLGYYTPHVSAKDIADQRAPYALPYLTLPSRVATKVGFKQYELSQLFRYRMYFDTFARLPLINAPRLTWREEAYGADLELLAPEATWTDEDLRPTSDQIHVRVRYAIGAHDLTYVGSRFAAPPRTARFSPWAASSFPAPWAAKRRQRKAKAPATAPA